VKPPLAEARGFHAQPLGQSDPRGASPLSGLSTLAKPPALHHPQPRGDWHNIFSSDPLGAKGGVSTGKALPARRFESVGRHLQERFPPVQAFAAWIASRRLSKTKRGAHRDPARRASRPGTVIPLRQRLIRVRGIQVAELGKARLPCARFDQFAPAAVISLRKTLTNVARTWSGQSVEAESRDKTERG
jgi:hypothetical protein